MFTIEGSTCYMGRAIPQDYLTFKIVTQKLSRNLFRDKGSITMIQSPFLFSHTPKSPPLPAKKKPSQSLPVHGSLFLTPALPNTQDYKPQIPTFGPSLCTLTIQIPFQTPKVSSLLDTENTPCPLPCFSSLPSLPVYPCSGLAKPSLSYPRPPRHTRGSCPLNSL